MRKNIFFLFCLLLPALLFSQDSIPSGVYDWRQPLKSKKSLIHTTTLFEGSVYDMEWLQMNANELAFSKKSIKMDVSVNEEQIYFIKTGKLDIVFHDSVNILVAGSVILLMPGEKFSIKNDYAQPCTYYVMKYKSKAPVNIERGIAAGGSFVKDWQKIEFKPSEKGGYRKYFERPTAMGKRLEMHVSTLKLDKKSHDPHTHQAEELILVMDGNTEMQIGQKFYQGKEGSIYYMGSNILHAIRNVGAVPCTYFAFQFE